MTGTKFLRLNELLSKHIKIEPKENEKLKRIGESRDGGLSDGFVLSFQGLFLKGKFECFISIKRFN